MTRIDFMTKDKKRQKPLADARGWVGYRSYQHEFISITCLSTGAARDPGHGTRIARGFVRYKGEKGTSISDPK